MPDGMWFVVVLTVLAGLVVFVGIPLADRWIERRIRKARER